MDQPFQRDKTAHQPGSVLAMHSVMSPDNNHDIVDWIKIRALSFDIYGTLIDWQDGIIDAALNSAIGPHLPSNRADLYKQLRSYDRVIEKEQPKWKKSEVNAEVLRRFASDLSLVEDGKVTQEEVETAAKQYGGAIGVFPAFPDTVSFDANDESQFLLSLHRSTPSTA